MNDNINFLNLSDRLKFDGGVVCFKKAIKPALKFLIFEWTSKFGFDCLFDKNGTPNFNEFQAKFMTNLFQHLPEVQFWQNFLSLINGFEVSLNDLQNYMLVQVGLSNRKKGTYEYFPRHTDTKIREGYDTMPVVHFVLGCSNIMHFYDSDNNVSQILTVEDGDIMMFPRTYKHSVPTLIYKETEFIDHPVFKKHKVRRLNVTFRSFKEMAGSFLDFLTYYDGDYHLEKRGIKLPENEIKENDLLLAQIFNQFHYLLHDPFTSDRLTEYDKLMDKLYDKIEKYCS